MSSSQPKYVRTEDCFALFSNCIPHADAFTKIFGYDEDPIGAGFVKYCEEENQVGFKLCGEKVLTGFEEFGNQCQDLKEAIKLLVKKDEPLKYLTTSSRFIIFSNDFSHKEIANSLLTEFIIQGAGYLTLSKEDGHVTINCFGESDELHIKSRPIDSLIINDAFTPESD